MKRSLNSLLLFLSIATTAPIHAVDIPGVSSLKLKAKILAEHASALFSYQNQTKAIKLYYSAEILLSVFFAAQQLASDVRNYVQSEPAKPVSKEIEEIFKKLKMDPSLYTMYGTPQPDLTRSSNATFNTNGIGGTIRTHSGQAKNRNEQLMLLGNELVHLRNHHGLIQVGASCVLALLTPLIQRESANCFDTAFDAIAQSKQLQKFPKVLGVLQSCKNGAKITVQSPLFKFFFVEGIKALTSRYLEKSADLTAAKALDCADGGISFFNTALEKEKNRAWTDFLNPALAFESFKKSLGFSNVPAPQERIKYLTELVNKK